MKGILIPSAGIAALVILAGCANTQPPTYAQVRDETMDVLDAVSQSIPEPKEIKQTPEFDPYPCNETLTLGTQKGAFFTGQWTIYVDEQFDISAFIERVPELLGDGWHEDPGDVPLAFDQIRMVRDSPSMSLTVEESVPGDRRAVELLAISRCGIQESAG